MLRSEISSVLHELITLVNRLEHAAVIINERDPAQDEIDRRRISILSAYSDAVTNFGGLSSSSWELARSMGLGKFIQPEYWHDALTQGILPDDEFLRVCQRMLSALGSLIDKEFDSWNFLDKSEKGKISAEVLRLVLPEAEAHPSRPDRLIEALASVSALYSACSELLGGQHRQLAVVSCDSGSDKSFDFLGAAKVIECVKELILSLWDKVVFYRELKMVAQLEIIANSLPILERLKSLEQNGSLGREQAELLRRKIVSGAQSFIASGSTIPEMEDSARLNPAALMTPEPKLLVGHTETEGKSDGSEAASSAPTASSEGQEIPNSNASRRRRSKKGNP